MSIDILGMIDGAWHVISTAPLVGCAEWMTLELPQRVFAGADTVHYAFESEAEGLAALGWDGTCYHPQELDKCAIIAALTAAVQHHLDSTARERGYDGILSLCTYSTSTNKQFSAEGQAGIAWRDACWSLCYEVMAECEAGTRAVPTTDGLVAMLPPFSWPEVDGS